MLGTMIVEKLQLSRCSQFYNVEEAYKILGEIRDKNPGLLNQNQYSALKTVSHVRVSSNFSSNSCSFYSVAIATAFEQLFASELKKLFQIKVAGNSSQWGSSAPHVTNKMAASVSSNTSDMLMPSAFCTPFTIQ
ncbi:UNVERIFIED_CONTAM: hypothetical protein NCL1_09409 [Trichonephila clavipes]